MKNIRNSVKRDEIIRYIKLREIRLHQLIMDENRGVEELKKVKIRHSEIEKLLQLIVSDEIREEIKKMYKHIAYEERNRVKKENPPYRTCHTKGESSENLVTTKRIIIEEVIDVKEIYKGYDFVFWDERERRHRYFRRKK